MGTRLSHSGRSSNKPETLIVLGSAVAASVAAARLDAFEWLCSTVHQFEHF